MKINKEIWDKINDRAKRKILCDIFVADVNASPGRTFDTIHGKVALAAVHGYSEYEIATELGSASLEIVKSALADIQTYVTREKGEMK
jgi:hypothetical protein